MMQKISDALSGPGCSEIVTSITQAQSFISAEDKVKDVTIFVTALCPNVCSGMLF